MIENSDNVNDPKSYSDAVKYLQNYLGKLTWQLEFTKQPGQHPNEAATAKISLYKAKCLSKHSLISRQEVQ